VARCDVELTESFFQAQESMSPAACEQVAVVIRTLEEECDFKADEAEFIIEVSRYVTACEHVQGWGWAIFWYREDGDKIVVKAERSVRDRLMPKTNS
jgi:hypothetical protein